MAPDPALSGFDLAEGQTQDWRRPGRIAALLAVLVLGLAAHFAVMGVKVHRARLAADATETQLRDALVKRGVKVGTSVDAAATAAIQAASGTPSAGFLAQLSRVMQVISTKAGVVTLQDLSYDNRSLRLTMTLLAPELGSLQDTANLLNAAGLKADLGASTIADGTARATITITGGAG